MVKKAEWYAATMLIGLLIACNAFFIKGLVGTIDTTSDKVGDVHVRLAILETKVSDLKEMIERKIRSTQGEQYYEDDGNGLGIERSIEGGSRQRSTDIGTVPGFHIRGSVPINCSSTRLSGDCS